MNAIDSPTRPRVVEIPIDETPSVASPSDSDSQLSLFQRWLACWWCDVLTLLCVGAGVLASLSFWRSWMQSPDRIAYLSLFGIGILVSAWRANKRGSRTLTRTILSGTLWSAALVWAIVAVAWHNPILGLVSIGVAMSAWCFMRIAGESIAFALSWPVGLALMAWISFQLPNGFFDRIPTTTMAMTAGLADAIKQAHVRDTGAVVFGRGVADQFECVGSLTGIITLLGLGVLLVLAFRRPLIAACLSLFACGMTWIAVRATAWTAMAWIADQQEIWTPWSPNLDWITFAIAVVVCISVDQAIGCLLAPIPDEYLNNDYPLFSLAWNWIFGLPQLAVSLPQRESDFPPIDPSVSSSEIAGDE